MQLITAMTIIAIIMCAIISTDNIHELNHHTWKEPSWRLWPPPIQIERVHVITCERQRRRVQHRVEVLNSEHA